MRIMGLESEQVERIAKLLSNAPDHATMKQWAILYILDPSYSRAAIAQAIHDVEVAKGWHQ